ncbi:MAG: sigma-70 family RNA polymerase sigma factor [Christensenellaceae bacterium]|nr:sigma-70 family RNA polymerase sigma factor [Christensenellaceae bacterium]
MDIIGNESLNHLFCKIYEATYHKTATYIIAKCNDLPDAEDILQNTYNELFCVLKNKGIDYITNINAFVMHIAKTKLKRHYSLVRRIKDNLVSLVDNQSRIADVPMLDDIEINFVNKEMVAEILKFLDKKPLIVKKIFALYFYYDHGLREISELLSMSESSVKYRLYTTLSEIRKIYADLSD